MFIKPRLETAAVWDPIRTCNYIGIWGLASKLKNQGHEVKILDEVTRDNGLNKQKLVRKTLRGRKLIGESLSESVDTYIRRKMEDYAELSPEKFVDKYTAFRENGDIVRDMILTGNEIWETLNQIGRENPDIIGIPLIASANYIPTIELGMAIRENFPNIKIILGGQHISALTDEFIRDNSWVDYIVVGDAINIITNIVEGNIKEKISYGGFLGMNNFPLLDPSLLEDSTYPIEPTYTYTTNGRKAIDFMFSRGCFRHCEFCFAGSQKGNHVTVTDYEKLGEQLDIFKQNGYEEIVVQDDAFLWDKKHVREYLPKILKVMKERGFYWQDNGGLEFEMMDDFVTEQFIEYNKTGKGRITALYIPFNPRQWNKGKSACGTMTTEYQRNFENLKKLREEAGIYIFTSEIIGTPEHTIDVLNSDIELHKQIIEDGHIDAALTLTATLLPGTVWYDNNKDMIINKEDWPGYSLFVPHCRTENIPDPKLVELYMVKRAKELDPYQKTYNWGTGFPNVKK